LEISKFQISVIIALLAVSFLLNLGISPLYFEEPRRALVAMEMVMSGNYVTPTIMGEYYYNKPPMFNWLIAAGYKLTGGYSEWISRLVSVFSFWIMALINYLFVAKNFNKKLALWSSLFLLISGNIYFYFSTLGEIDLFYAMISFGSIASIIHGYWQNKNAYLFAVSYLLAAVGFLTKGFPSPIFVGATFVVLAAVNKDWRLLLNYRHLLGLAIFIALVGSYFLLYNHYNDANIFLDKILSQSSDRTADKGSFKIFINHFSTFPIDTIKDVLPATAFSLLLLLKPVRRAFFSNKKLILLLLVFLLNYAVYWISPGTRARYIYMLYPLLIIPLISCFQIFVAGNFKLKVYLQKGLASLAILAAIALGIVSFVIPESNNFIIAISIILGLSLLMLGVVFWQKMNHQLILMLLIVVVFRIWFNVVVLPVRANEGPRADDKALAMQWVELINDKKMYLLYPKYPGVFPLESAYYFQKEANQILHVKPIDCENYFLANDNELNKIKKGEVETVHTFSWRNIPYKIVKLNCN